MLLEEQELQTSPVGVLINQPKPLAPFKQLLTDVQTSFQGAALANN